jgi:hypothetical protein
MAFDSRYEEEAARPPISLHPAFPGIVALWFAALLGLGSLVLPPVLLERAVVGTGLASLVPMANPPLGFAARGVIALVATLAGAGLGVAIARRVARAHSPGPESRIAKLASGSRRPLSVKDELGGANGLRRVVNGESLPISRRRALAISEDDRPSDFLYRAPLPGEDPDAPATLAAAPIAATVTDDEPLELSDLAEPGVDPCPAGPPEPAETADPDETDGDFDMTDSRESKSAWPSHQHLPPEPEMAAADELDTRKNLAGPRGLEPLPFSPPSLARRAPQVDFAFQPEPEPQGEPSLQLEAVAAPAPAASETPEFRADWETAPLEGLGLVQLVQRLGSTIERRRARAAQDPVQPAAPVGFTQADFEPAPADEAVQAMAAFFGSTPVVEPQPEPQEDPAVAIFAPAPRAPADEPASTPRPGFLRSFTVPDEDDGEDAVPDFSLPLRRSAAPAPSFSLADNDAMMDEASEDDDGTGEETGEETANGYSSLLGMANPFAAPKSEFVRIEEPEDQPSLAEPAVVFPGQEGGTRLSASDPTSANRLFDPPGKATAPAQPAAQPPADADAALRAALATLQRMSGAA